jgi:uncharacterized RDD family membrane protein YckC
MEHAGFWRRLCATVVDLAFLALILCISTVIFCLITGHSIDLAKGYIVYGLSNVILLAGYLEGFFYALFYAVFDSSVILTHYLDELSLNLPADATPSLFHLTGQVVLVHSLFAIYNSLFEASYLQASPGKRVLQLRVIHHDGKPLTFWQALGRNLLKIPATLVLGLGHLFIAFSKTKQAAYDHAAGAFVVCKPSVSQSNSYPTWQ